ncbi:MAG: protease pro-enzyme activation domain-containing protein [Candidatus Solibacter sp.]|jgi:uncharacterized protein (TIGR03437 family)
MSPFAVVPRRRFGVILVSCLLLSAPALLAQPDRIPTSVDNLRTVPLKGNRTPRALPQDDQGRVDPLLRIGGMRLRLKPSPIQAAQIAQLLAEQQDPASPNYRNWLTPEEYADRFGLSSNDFAAVLAWLQSQGFTLDYVARARNSVGFSGTAGQVENAFHTEIHRYTAGRETHYANATDPSIPADLAPVVQVIRGLDDFRIKPMARPVKPVPLVSGNGTHVLGPADLATIYNVNPLYQKGIDGSGQKIAVISGSAVLLSDIQAFRQAFGVPKNDPQQVLVPGYPDPGVISDAEGEADLDLQYAGGIAPGATILSVYASDMAVALEYAIDQNLAPIISTSWGVCEAEGTSGPSDFAAWETVAQQANLQGATWLASSGDSGAAGCDPHQKVQVASDGLGVLLPSSLPEVTALGGTEFNDSTGTYWNTTNGTGLGSALGYIPEVAWNDTALDTSLGGGLAATGGGASNYFPKPVWQTASGVPAANHRYVPDLSLAASWDHDPYAVSQEGSFIGSGGTSASTPLFAGIVALLNQYLVSNHALAKAGLGNINPTLYRLAQSAPTIFHDITAGSNIVPCTSGTPDCSGGQLGYNAGVGFDLATGLGSVDVYALVTQWSGTASTPAPVATNTTLSANPVTVTTGATTTLTATVKASSGTVSPTGTVSFIQGKTAVGSATLSGSGGSATAALTVRGSQLAVGSNTITASYGGSTSFSASSGAATVTVTVPTTASAVIPSIVPNPVFQQQADADGYSFFYTVRLSEIAGSATTLTAFSIDATDHTADIPAFFGTAAIPANGTIFASIRSKLASVPLTRVFDFAGVDGGGQKWSQEITVPFYPKQLSASLSLTSSPGTEIQNPNGDSRCPAGSPYYQQLNLQENNGYGVLLTRFLAGGSDATPQIGNWFGTLHLAPLGALQAGLCWKLGTVPTTLDYEIAGVDTAGNNVSATLQVPFQGPGQSAGALSVSKSSIALNVAPAQSASTTLSVTVPSGQQWSLAVFPANQKTSWLVVSPAAGTGTSQVSLLASAAGLADGVYTATLVFQSVNTAPQFVNVLIVFTVGASSAVSLSGAANGASFQSAAAPGMILSVFGKGLANSTLVAPSVPLPLTLGGVSVTVNGVAAPLYFVSPTQLNVQLPYETVTGTAILAVNNNGQAAAGTFPVKASAPGIFVGANSRIVPISSARAGDSVVFYITGEGDVTPAVTTGVPPPTSLPVSQLPAPRLPLSMTVGGLAVTPFFVGIPYGLVGVTQINFTMPPNLPAGDQSVVVTVGGVASPAAKLLVTQ